MIRNSISLPISSNSIVEVIRDRKIDTASNTAAVITIPARAGLCVYLHRVQWSYDGTPTGGLLTVEDGSTAKWQQAITAAGPGGQDPDEVGTVGTAMEITLAAGGAGVVGRIASVRGAYVAVRQ